MWRNMLAKLRSGHRYSWLGDRHYCFLKGELTVHESCPSRRAVWGSGGSGRLCVETGLWPPKSACGRGTGVLLGECHVL